MLAARDSRETSPEGSNAHRLQRYVEEPGSIEGYPNGQKIGREEFFGVQADIFVPAALENQAGPAEAESLQVRLVAEGRTVLAHQPAKRSCESAASTCCPT